MECAPPLQRAPRSASVRPSPATAAPRRSLEARPALPALFRLESLLACCALAAILSSLFVWVGAQHVRIDPALHAPPPVQLAASLDTATAEATSNRFERGSASLFLDSPTRDALVLVLLRVCALLDRVPPALRAGAGSEVCR